MTLALRCSQSSSRQLLSLQRLPLAFRTFKSSHAADEKAKDYLANTVILHQIGRGPYAPSMSPFPIKLETYLRMAKIPYQNYHGRHMSSKGKTPWITYNGEVVSDSQFCIEFLNKRLNKDINEYLTSEQKAIARALQKMAEESLYWVLLIERWIYVEDDYQFLQITMPRRPLEFIKELTPTFKTMAHGHGYGRHTKDEIRSIAKGDLKAISHFLGRKPYLMGSKPCEEDCTIFGILAQLKWQDPGNVYAGVMTGEFNNLSEYCDRMKEDYWPDWDECNTAGGTRQAIK